MLVPAIQSGIDARDYWLLTLGEIQATIEAYNRNLNLQVELSRQTSYTTAALVANFVGLSFNGKPLPSYEECFGGTATSSGEEHKPVEEWEAYRAQWTAYAVNYNRKRQNKLGG